MVAAMASKHFRKTATATAFAATSALIGAMAFASPALAAVETIFINEGNVPTTAMGYGTQSCDNIPLGAISTTDDGWVFVLPASSGAEGNFLSVSAIFVDENDGVHVLTTADDGGIVSGSGDNKAYLVSPPGWRLVDAQAEVEDPDQRAFFNLTHTCPGNPRAGGPR
jgi:hypothetical protein